MIKNLKKTAFFVVLLLFLSQIFYYKNSTICAANLLQKDIDFVYNCLKDNHPGFINSQDLEFKQILEQEYSKALKQSAASNEDLDFSKKVLRDFVQAFNDTHLRVWFPSPKKNDQEKKTAITSAEQASLKYQKLTEKILWVSLPTFDVDSIEGQMDVFSKILKKIEELNQTQNQTLVLDLRGNGGGSSMYGSQIIDALFGKDYADTCKENALKNVFVHWRASKDNLANLEQICSKVEKTEIFPWALKITNGVRDALTKGISFYQEECASMVQPKNKVFNHNVTSRVIVIIDEGNASSALTFLDQLKMMNYPILLVGEKTSADTIYMEVSRKELPSKNGALVYPIKMYVNRARKNNEPYFPDIKIDKKTLNNDALLKNYILRLCEEPIQK